MKHSPDVMVSVKQASFKTGDLPCENSSAGCTHSVMIPLGYKFVY